MSNVNDFEIQNGILVRYNGNETIAVIPDCVTRIGDYAFDNCTELKSVIIPNSVTVIGERAFFRCNSLESVAVPDSVTSIGVRAFEECSSLKSITIPDSVLNIGNYAFSGCKNISEISIPEGVTLIDSGVFDNCSKLEKICIPDGVTSIGGSAFYKCESLKSINVPDSVTSIGLRAFQWCKSLKDIRISEGMTSIEMDAFSGCESLASINIPDSIKSVGERAFQYCDSLVNIIIPEGVASIGIEAFKSCDSLASVELPNSLTSIGGGAFNGCGSLKEITVPSSVKSIGWSAFWGCENLKSVTIPDSVNVIGDDGSFYQKVYLNGPYIFNEKTEVVFNSYVKGVGNNDVSQRLIFRKTPIQEIKSTNTKEYAVNGFLTTEDLSIYDDSVVDSYRKYLKGRIIKFISFILDNDAAQIIRRLASLDLMDNRFIESIKEYELSDEVKALLSEISEQSNDNKKSTDEKKALSVTELKKRWSYTKNEEGLNIDNYKDFETKVIIPDRIGKDAVMEIGYRAFSPIQFGIREKQSEIREKITSVTIPDGVTNIEAEAFMRCDSLETIMIPASVINIDPGAFYGCYNVTIHAAAGSYAEKYAKRFDIKFKIADDN